MFYNHLANKAKGDGIDRIAVGAVIFDEQSRILILVRPSHEFMGGLEELPSGKLDGDEDIHTALLREVKEESNLNITEVLSYVGHFDYKSKSGKQTRQYTFAVKTKTCDNVRLTEHDSFKWQTVAEALANPKISHNVKHCIQVATFNHNRV